MARTDGRLGRPRALRNNGGCRRYDLQGPPQGAPRIAYEPLEPYAARPADGAHTKGGDFSMEATQGVRGQAPIRGYDRYPRRYPPPPSRALLSI
jgi:hypothetical protein